MDNVSDRETRPCGNVSHWEGLYRQTSAALPWEVDWTPTEFVRWATLIPPGASILDLGCGRGRHTLAMARRGFHVHGIDFSAAAVAAARRAAASAGLTTATFAVANLLDQRPNPVFDLVYDYSVLHHIDVGDRSAYRRTVAGVVRPGGLFAVVCYADDDPVAAGGRRRIGTLGNVIHHPTRQEVDTLFGEGFRLTFYEATRLGRGVGHRAHHFIFRRMAPA
ncbi:class I SAM-dependent methyltransferase [Actinomadura citrea]|uniref:class I SAM-dependent methyltransferase n=1 Tax=Actinomadura citrea TaxID=46158 RepID=UPI003CE4BA6E